MNTLSNSFYNKKSFLNRTIILPFPKENYSQILASPLEFRAFIEKMVSLYPQLFPKDIQHGFKMKDFYHSKKLYISFRRITIGTQAYSIRPSFVMPYMTAFTDDVENALFLRKFSVPYWALAHLYGRNSMFWYRLETSLGRHSLVSTTIRCPSDLPQHLVADEKFSSINGERVYITTTAAKGCLLGTELVNSTDETGLEEGYKVFKEEALQMNPSYSIESVNLDGWDATKNVFKKLFEGITIIPCFLHIYLKLRDSFKRKCRELFLEVAEKMWDCFRAETKREFAQRTRRMVEWAFTKKEMPEGLLKGVLKVWKKNEELQKSYEYEGSYRTSNLVDRLMQRMKSHLKSTKEFHGSRRVGSLNIRGWALLQNFTPSHPRTIKKYGGIFQSPAERLNQFQYHTNWLHNLLVSTSNPLFKIPPQKT